MSAGMAASTRRILLVTLAGVALVALVVAAFIVMAAVKHAGLWLIVLTVVVALALVGEIVLLILGRSREDEGYEFVIDADAPTQPR